MNTIAYILEQQFIDDIKLSKYNIKITTDEYKNFVEYEIFSFAANIALILNDCRLAYSSDIQNNSIDEHMKKLLFEYDDTLMEIKYSWGIPLIILKKNYELIQSILSKRNIDQRSNLGRVLGYLYYDEGWDNLHADRYGVKYLIRYNKENYNLYGFMVPTSKYNIHIQQIVFEDLAKYKNILKRYGFKIYVDCVFYPKKEDNSISTYIYISIACCIIKSLLFIYNE